MLRNNLFSLLTHIICMIIALFLAVFFQVYCPYLAYISVFLLILYLVVGVKSRPQKSVGGNILSVSAISIGGLLLYGTSLIVSSNLLKALVKFYVLPVTNVFMNITNNTEQSNIDNPLIFAGLILVPTLLMWLGLQFKVKTELPKKFHLLLIYTGGFFLLIALIVAGEIFPGKFDDVKLNYRGDKIFFEERVWDKYYLYVSDLKLRHKTLIYSGTSPANRITPNPGKNIVLFTYRKNGDERDQTVCLYDYSKHKYIYQARLSSYRDKIAWSKDGDQLFFNSYLGLTALDLKDLRLKNETQKYHLLMNKGFSYDCFDWSVKGDQLIYTIFSDLFLFDRNTGRNTKLKSLDLIKSASFDFQEYFTQIFFINHDQSVLYSYQEGPEFPGKIAVFDLTTHTVKHLYDAPNPQETHAGDSITDLVIEKVLNDQYIIISEYDMVNESEPQPYTIYLFNLYNQKSVRLYKTYNTISTWDVNGMTQQMVCINSNRIKIIDLKPYLKKIAK
jgi:hypothetical protein